MAEDTEAQVLSKIQETYVPFLKKLIAFLEKNKKATPDNLNKLKAIYTIFTTAPSREQVETFHANQKKLENWYNKAQKEKHEEGEGRGTKRSLVLSDTESSQGASDSGSSHKRKTFSNSFDNESPQPSIASVQSVTPIPISQIKKEKLDPPRPKRIITPAAPPTPTPTPPAPPTTHVALVVAPAPTVAVSAPSADEPITYTCASCQFQTKDETDFMKHARTDHRTDLSMWCKQCGKCFSNAGVLVSHIKERACLKEDMIYKCGVKDCVFETTSGQTFVHHLRHCHKGSPFIFCVHCQKIFTLPHCLILHMQDDCPFKDKNRRNPSGASADSANTAPKTNAMVPAPTAVIQPIMKTPPVSTYTPRPVTAAPSIRPTFPALGTPLRGRGRAIRGRGRGRSRNQMSDSSDSDDPDDPSWRPEESLDESTVRRSARWAKKINDVRNPEPSTSGMTTAKKSFSSAEINTNMISCPCCDFMAAFQSVLEDHYIANHKVPNKNACLVCHLKFENTRSFLDHFEEHRKGVLPNLTEMAESSKPVDKPAEKVSSNTSALIPTSTVAVSSPVVLPPVADLPPVAEKNETVAPVEKESFEGVLTSIDDAHLAKPKARSEPVKIPYQAAIHDKNMKDSKLKKFEELKSPTDLNAMKAVEKLKNFFKCGLYNCSYTTNDSGEYSSHLLLKHEGKRYHCCYCLKEYFNCESMASHVASNHNKRLYQCNKCFYRGYSKAHVQIHLNNFHGKEQDAEILFCEQVTNTNTSELDPVPDALDTTWPYICAIGECNFNTYDPKEFKKHNETVHRTVSMFFCHYCKVDFLTFKRLMNHYRLHGLNTFQCNYCIHGADSKEEILLHLSNAHADLPLKAYMRGSHEEATSEVKKLNNTICEDSNDGNSNNYLENKMSYIESLPSVKESLLECEKGLYHVIDNKYYPKELQLACFPRYTQSLVSNVVCGIPFCQVKFDSIPQYISHLRNVHDALNFPCPHCPEKFDSWEDFKNHVLCHGSKLYVCSSAECGFYDWNKERVKQHKTIHDATDNVFAVREYTSTKNEEFMVNTLDLPCEIPKADNTLVCLFCRYKCSDRSIMKNHMYKELSYLRFCCRLCDKRYLSRKDIKNHFTASHPGLDIICSTDINTEVEAVVKTVLELHDKFQDMKMPESCVMCCRRIKNTLRLHSHQYICLQKEYFPFKCSHCKKAHVNLLALVYHIDQEHTDKPIDYTVSNNLAIEDDIGKGLLKVRLKQLKDAFKDLKIEIKGDVSSKLKFYTCSVCPFEAHHKFSVQKHIQEQHDDKSGVVIKAMQRLDSLDNSHTDENSNDGTSFVTNIKMYGCGFCVRKMYTIQEMENHVKRFHPTKNAEEYFYYYTPDDNSPFSPDDKDTYECAYCKSSRENLYSLKMHSDLMHAEMDFKVKGFVSRVQSQNYLACGHCYLQMKSEADLRSHTTLNHPLLAMKMIGDILVMKAKRAAESADDIPNKRVKLGSVVYVCSHCGGAFLSQEQVTSHSKRSHRSSKLEFCRIDQATNGAESGDIKFYKCEFCKFTSERHYLDKHLATKHKSRVTCFYCNKQFEYASKLKEHHEVAHKDSPLKYSQETVNVSAASNDSQPSNNAEMSPSNNIDGADDGNIPMQPFSYYGKQPEPIDLSSLTVHMDTKDGPSAKLSLVYVTELFNMFPKVVLKDCKKDKEF